MSAAEHSPVGASSMARWQACPGSVWLPAPPNEESEYAARGTLGHTCLEALLTGQEMPAEAPEELRASATLAADLIRALLDDTGIGRPPGRELVEQKVYPIPGRGDVFGTADYVAISRNGQRLLVADYKAGMGVEVPVEYNSQVLFYAAGAMNALRVMPHKVRLAIIQPDAPSGYALKQWETTGEFVDAWRKAVLVPALERVEAAREQPQAHLAAGDHCRFCPALPTCPMVGSYLDMVAKVAGGGAELPLGDRARLVALRTILGKALRRMEDDLLEQARNGVSLPGLKVVRGNGSRNWAEGAEEWLKEHLGDAAFVVQPKSVAQVEEQFGAVPRELVVRTEGSLRLAAAADRRKAVPFAELAAPKTEFPDDLPEDEAISIEG